MVLRSLDYIVEILVCDYPNSEEFAADLVF